MVAYMKRATMQVLFKGGVAIEAAQESRSPCVHFFRSSWFDCVGRATGLGICPGSDAQKFAEMGSVLERHRGTVEK
jgi:hypothetical protein